MKSGKIPSVTIIICSRNRANSLQSTLESIGQATVPPGWQVELLVVDNGSIDHTREVVHRTRLNNIKVRYVSEPTIGVASGKNTGLNESTGEVILFADDDVRVPRNWIEGMCQPIFDEIADAVQGGVRIAPHLERAWLTGALRVWMAAVENPQHPPDGFVGANMSIHRRVLKVASGFDPRLGPGAAGFYEDTIFGWKLEKANQRILYLPTLSVEHHFLPERLALGPFVRIAERQAKSRALAMRIMNLPEARPTIFNLLHQLPGFSVRCLTQIVSFSFRRKLDAGFLVRYYYLRLWIELRREIPSRVTVAADH